MTTRSTALSNQQLRFEPLAGLAAGTVIVIGVLVLAGWAAGIEPLKRVVPGFVSMNPVTALAFVMAGASLWWQRHSGQPPRPATLRWARALAAGVAAIGLVCLSGYAFGLDLGVDRLLFSEALAGDLPDRPNRMAPNTALSFFCLGLALCWLNYTTRQGFRPTELLAVTVVMLSLLALIGYAYRVQWLYGVASFIPMALHTAVLLHLLAWGALFARPAAGCMALVTSPGLAGALIRRLVPGMVLIFILLGWLRLAGERRGWYGSELGVALNSIATITIITGLLWWNARSLHRAETRRERTEAERERFFTLSLDLLSIAGADGYFKRLNPAFSKTLGHDPAELLARPFLDFVHPDDRAATLQELQKLGQGEPTLQFENRYRCADGSWKWLSWRVQPFPEEGLLYATARDVTEYRTTQEAIQRLNTELALRAAQLEDVNRELEAFSYSVSHDLRAPLRHMQGYAEMLQRATNGELPAKAGRFLQTIIDAGVEMGRFIDELLAYSRLGRTELQTSPVPLDPLVRQVIQDLEMTTKERQIEWKIAPLPVVAGDPTALRQVFVNLIGNAVKYSRNRAPAEIEIGVAGEEDGLPVLFVRDNGAGFDMQYAGKLFGVFQRLHRADEFEGTGIGLATVRRVVARHGGRTWAEGVVDQGATFYFTLKPAPNGRP
jgi:PAS domain S-box-containing protein